MKKLTFFVLLLLTLSTTSAFSQAARIFLEGEFSDWQNLPPLYQDLTNDHGSDQVDFQNLWAANDERYLFLRIQLGQLEVNLQDNNRIVFYLDTDNNASTGLPFQGIGAELEWRFGERRGTFYTAGQTLPISQNDLGIVTAPTVSSREFEISLDRFAVPGGAAQLFSNDSIRIAFASLAGGGDLLPNAGEKIIYAFDDTPLPPLSPISLQKQDLNSLRVLSYNVLFDGLFDNSRVPAFSRILMALQPEVIGFQEIYSHTADQTLVRVASILPLTGNARWYASKVDPDIVAVSRFQITQTFAVEGNGVFLIDLRPRYESDLLLIVAHPPCCTQDAARQFEIDAMMAFIRDAKTAGGVLDIAPNTPIILIGDFNLVGASQQLRTLLTGEIINTAQFGAGFAPDWDGSDFADLTPRHVASPMFFTWSNPSGSFSPGRLDYMIYSNSVIDVTNSFALFTPEMSGDSLAEYHLLRNDTEAANSSDHLPIIGDFALKSTTSAHSSPRSNRMEFELLQNYPNPFNPSTTIQFSLLRSGYVTLKVYNTLGKEVATLAAKNLPAGKHQATWNASGLADGVYFYRLQAGDLAQTKKLIIAK
jgi:hypothetical protein